MEEKYFKKALFNFSQDMANGGAIRHLWNLGYSIRQIMERLDYPAPYGRIQEVVWQHLLDTGTISLVKPEAGKEKKFSYVKEYDKYGRTSFRRVEEIRDITGEDYIPCDFGLFLHQDREKYLKLLSCLDERQREYITDIPWRNMRVYHKPEERMKKIWEIVKFK